MIVALNHLNIAFRKSYSSQHAEGPKGTSKNKNNYVKFASDKQLNYHI